MLIPGLSRLHGKIRCQKPQNKNKKKEEDRKKRREEEEGEEKGGGGGAGKSREMREEEVATVTNQNNASVRITRTKYNCLVSYIFTLVSPYRKTELRIKISGPTGQILIC